jgi:hypothetical protein
VLVLDHDLHAVAATLEPTSVAATDPRGQSVGEEGMTRMPLVGGVVSLTNLAASRFQSALPPVHQQHMPVLVGRGR